VRAFGGRAAIVSGGRISGCPGDFSRGDAGAYAQISEIGESPLRAASLNPHVSAEAAVAGMPEVFERMVEDVEDELTRYCTVTAPTPSQGAEATRRGRGAVDVALQAN
jgi:hypothetical protein